MKHDHNHEKVREFLKNHPFALTELSDAARNCCGTDYACFSLTFSSKSIQLDIIKHRRPSYKMQLNQAYFVKFRARGVNAHSEK